MVSVPQLYSKTESFANFMAFCFTHSKIYNIDVYIGAVQRVRFPDGRLLESGWHQVNALYYEVIQGHSYIYILSIDSPRRCNAMTDLASRYTSSVRCPTTRSKLLQTIGPHTMACHRVVIKPRMYTCRRTNHISGHCFNSMLPQRYIQSSVYV